MAVTLEIKAVPGSGRQQWVLDKAGTLKCYLKGHAERGQANQELITRVAKALRIPRSDVTIIRGLTDRKKVVKINASLSKAHVLSLLGIEVQQSLLED